MIGKCLTPIVILLEVCVFASPCVYMCVCICVCLCVDVGEHTSELAGMSVFVCVCVCVDVHTCLLSGLSRCCVPSCACACVCVLALYVDGVINRSPLIESRCAFNND